MKKYTITAGNVPKNMSLHGLLPDLTRMPANVAETVSEGVAFLVTCAAGGRVRFKTDSAKIRLDVTLAEGAPNCAADVLCDGELVGRVLPEIEEDPVFGGELTLGEAGKMKSITVFFPRTHHTNELSISLDDDAAVLPADPYAVTKPVVYYGSSITMGAISTSPSRAYTALVSERLGVEHLNLGFGGNAKGEREMAEYIASLDMSAFVFDYEHNAPTIDHLRETHKPFFDIIRKAHPTLPILMISRPDTDLDPFRAYAGRRVIMDTFHTALDDGDRFVDYVDGFYLRGNEDRHLCCNEDGAHPNDRGFAIMADVVAPRLKSLMERSGAFDYIEPDGNDGKYQTNL